MRRYLGAAVLISFWTGLLIAQDVPKSTSDDDLMARPSEHGIRLTPGMARAMSRAFTREVLIQQYGMDEARSGEAIELVARRLMQVAHENEEKGQEAIENLLTQTLEMQVANQASDGYRGITPELAKEAAQRIPPLMPAIRGLIDGVAKDVQPMLPLKGQLKMTAELTMVKLAASTFEKNLERWSKGDVDPYADPFRDSSQSKQKDEKGETELLKRARKTAAGARFPFSRMESYLDGFKKHYQLDASQSAAADSLFREYQERAKTALGGEEEWRAEIGGFRFWMVFAEGMSSRWYNPVTTMLWTRYMQWIERARAIHDEFVDRLDGIVTQAQRQAAEEQFRSALIAKGYDWDEECVNASPTALIAPAKEPILQSEK